MLKFTKRQLRKLVNWATSDDLECESVPQPRTIGGRDLGDHRNAMNFSIQRANGGYIVEYIKYDRKRDENDRNLHIITEDADFGDSVAKIVTVEMLRH